MKRILFYLLSFSGLCTSSFSQTADKPVLVVQYTLIHVIDTTQRDFPMTLQYTLLQGKNMSKYDSYYNVLSDEGRPAMGTGTDASGRVISMPIMGTGGNKYFKDIKRNLLITDTYLGTNFYAVEEPIDVIDWKISPDTKQIKGYKCQKATGRFKGRNYTAWFTPEIPFRTGPWKLGGLPGLILEAVDESHDVDFRLVEVETAQLNYHPIEVAKESIVIPVEKFKKLEDALKKDKAALAGASSIKTGNMSASSVRASSNTSNRPPRQFNNPLEK